VYKSGWVEQGGKCEHGVEITLLKPMLDTNYTITSSFTYSTSTNTVMWSYIGWTKTTTSIKLAKSGVPQEWEVKGQGA
jgi:hypothetical protein